MSDVLRNDIFHFSIMLPVEQGFYRLCKYRPLNPQFYLPNLLVTDQLDKSELPPYYANSICSKELYDAIEDGDIGIVNNGNMLRVILSRKANHNTVLVTERCNNRCLFCSQPPKTGNDDWLLSQSALSIASFSLDGVIGVSGGEPLLYGDDFLNFLDFIIENSPATSLHVLTNGRRFSDAEFTKKIKERSDKIPITFGIPLYSSRSSIHDYLVDCEGAFGETVKGLINAGNSGINIELRIIPTQANYNDLDDIVEFAGRVFSNINQISLMGLESIGWARKNWSAIFIDHNNYTQSILSAVDTADRAGIPLTIFNYPLCHLPEKVWKISTQSISDWKNFYPKECDECTQKSSCAGYFSSSKGRFHQPPRPIK
ncbi:MAG: His-Xaa-Ser system radical SAM maturase HxsC [Ewingella americana]|uniref:His-Xaa-Ser system radical SAM maturase HxsC n=1 Tax=Ewingella americana TaxID=41202 RepID=UPI00243165DB|nr:His-Xaa-Ser system radical SAM maturase HxsC [Ewingella americana]MCI1677608.1 His-Xaa-Ser system radical SAM maturase HxsC [Ewingella americana]MCI1852703.1 His-Xaa-Ser system radical SAM maturase HxsC [Ewingella americana]MCI1861211.1 His-Xaa-Ser system radical SAM maturase HxsC [Ewingella americana]MCI2143972.1 His-Xaa-Ser system radical SAM maturase HxsC [Ewingella americana]MCI2162730.1 His-Xaa-Ser system radical SAM maturase HxsC [Ewingella americana]